MAEIAQRAWFYPFLIILSLGIRVILIVNGLSDVLVRRMEMTTPVNSLFRLKEAQWLMRMGFSPYAGSVYHCSPLLIHLLDTPISRSPYFYVICDLVSSFFLYKIASVLNFQTELMNESKRKKDEKKKTEKKDEKNIHHQKKETVEKISPLQSSNLFESDLLSSKNYKNVPNFDQTKLEFSQNGDSMSVRQKLASVPSKFSGKICCLLFLLNPLSVLTCVGGSTSSLENMIILSCIYYALNDNIILSSFTWILSSHLSLYPLLLLIPILLLILMGSDEHYQYKKIKIFNKRNCMKIASFFFFSFISFIFFLLLSYLSLDGTDSLLNVFYETYVYILSFQDLNPRMGVLWYFFSEIFSFYRLFFVLVWHLTLLSLSLLLLFRFSSRPLFLSFLLLAMASLMKSLPSVGDFSLYFSLFPLFLKPLAGMRFSYVLFFGYLYTFIFQPIIYHFWMELGAGNSNFYFSIGMVFTLVQILFVVESMNAMLKHDRELKKNEIKFE